MHLTILGSGALGGTVGTLAAGAGHRVTFGSRRPERLAELVVRARERARSVAGISPEEARAFIAAAPLRDAAADAQVVLLAAPYEVLEDLLVQVEDALAGKVVLDATNPVDWPDGGEMTLLLPPETASAGVLARRLPRCRVAKVFATVNTGALDEATREVDAATGTDEAVDRLVIPVAADDPEARQVAETLVRDVGFVPWHTGGLDDAQAFDPAYEPPEDRLWNRPFRESGLASRR